jgi:hypothetical protein
MLIRIVLVTDLVQNIALGMSANGNMKLVIGDIDGMRIRVHLEGETIEDDLYITREGKWCGMMVFSLQLRK